MKFGQLIEYNVRNTFLKDYTQNGVEKLFPDLFVKNQNVVCLWINSLKFLHSLFILYSNFRPIEI